MIGKVTVRTIYDPLRPQKSIYAMTVSELEDAIQHLSGVVRDKKQALDFALAGYEQAMVDEIRAREVLAARLKMDLLNESNTKK